MTEEWRDVQGFEGFYKVSNLGRVKSMRRGVLLSTGTGRGYVMKTLFDGQKRWIVSVHRLVALAFVEGSGPQINHKNGIKHDNRAENLEWCDNSHNVLHSMYELGNMIKPVAAFNDRERFEFRSIALAVKSGFKEPKIHRCLNNPQWKHKGYYWARISGGEANR